MHPSSSWHGPHPSSTGVPSTGFFTGKGSTPSFHQLSSTSFPTTSPPTTSTTSHPHPSDFGMVAPTGAGPLPHPGILPTPGPHLPLTTPPLLHCPPHHAPALPRDLPVHAPQPLAAPPVPHHAQPLAFFPQRLTTSASFLSPSMTSPIPPSPTPPTPSTPPPGHGKASPPRPRPTTITAELRRMIESTVDSRLRNANQLPPPKPAPLPPPPAAVPPPPAEAPPPPLPPPTNPAPSSTRPHDDTEHRSRTGSKRSSSRTRRRTSTHSEKSQRDTAPRPRHRSHHVHSSTRPSSPPSRTHERTKAPRRERQEHEVHRRRTRDRSPARDHQPRTEPTARGRTSRTSKTHPSPSRRSPSRRDKSRRTPPRYRDPDMPRRSRRRSPAEAAPHRPERSHRSHHDDRRSHREHVSDSHRTASDRAHPSPRSPRQSSIAFRLRSRTRSHRGRSTTKSNIKLTPKQHLSSRPPPLPPPTSTPPSEPTPLPPPPPPRWDATTTRIADGDTDDSDTPRDATAPIPSFSESVGWVQEFKEAAADPHRPLLPSEVTGPRPALTEEFTGTTKKLHKEFIDMMYQCLAEPYTTRNGSQLLIRVDRSAIDNLAICFAKSNLLDIELAKKTQGWFIESNRLLTVTVPTGFPLHDPFHQDESAWYLCYHKTDWPNIPKILLDKMVRPAAWSRNEHGHPAQYPSYGFFGYASQVSGRELDHHAIAICTRNLNKIGKSQYPAGVLTITRCPVWERLGAGGNDQLQRQCRYAGAARGKEGYAAMHSAYASVQFVTVTFNLNPSDLTWLSVTDKDKDLAGNAS